MQLSTHLSRSRCRNNREIAEKRRRTAGGKKVRHDAPAARSFHPRKEISRHAVTDNSPGTHGTALSSSRRFLANFPLAARALRIQSAQRLAAPRSHFARVFRKQCFSVTWVHSDACSRIIGSYAIRRSIAQSTESIDPNIGQACSHR